jgi:hypothetical protein
MSRIAIIGLTEHSLQLADVLRNAGAQVVGFDAAPPPYAPVTIVASVEEAVSDVDVVLVFPTGPLALSLAQQIAPQMKSGAVYADFSATTPSVKQRISEIVSPGSCVDAALIRENTIEASGKAASGFVKEMSALQVDALYVSDVAGDVATRMLVRRLWEQSLSTAITDTLWAAESLGLEDWAWEEIQTQLAAMDAEQAQQLINDTATNFKRHQMEMQDVLELLVGSEYESTMVAPIQFTHGRIMHGKKIPHSQAPTPKWLK